VRFTHCMRFGRTGQTKPSSAATLWNAVRQVRLSEVHWYRQFQARGPAALKALSPKLVHVWLTRSVVSAERNLLGRATVTRLLSFAGNVLNDSKLDAHRSFPRTVDDIAIDISRFVGVAVWNRPIWGLRLGSCRISAPPLQTGVDLGVWTFRIIDCSYHRPFVITFFRVFLFSAIRRLHNRDYWQILNFCLTCLYVSHCIWRKE